MSAIRPEVQRFVDLGPLPSVVRAEAHVVQLHQDLLEAIEPPVSLDEARLLLQAFGEDDCFGLAWSLLHLIETAGTEVVEIEPDPDDEWRRRIWEAAQRSR